MSIGRILDRQRKRAAIAVVASLAVHSATFAAIVTAPQWLIRQMAVESPVFAGQRQAIQIESAWSIAQPTAELESIVIVEPVQITPTEAVVEHQRMVARSSAEMPLPVVEAAIAEHAVGQPRDLPRQEQPATRPTTETAASQPVERRPAATPPTSVASVAMLPQSHGTDSTRPPKFAGNRPPNYPLLAQQRGWEGTVLLALRIDERGHVTEVTIARSSGYDVLDAEAIAAVREWRGEPAMRNGQAVATEETLPVRFRLR
jgi:protein TonB